MHGGQQTGYHRISGISSRLLRARGSNIKVLIISMLPSTAIYNPPRLSEKSRREQKSLYPTTGAATNSQSSLGVLLLLRQSPPRLSEKSRREQKSLYPTTGAATNSQSSLGVLLLLRQSPPRLSEKSRREQKSLYPTTGATTDSQSSLGVLLLLRQSPP